MILQTNQIAQNRIDRNLRDLNRAEFHWHMLSISIHQTIIILIMCIFGHGIIELKPFYIIIGLVGLYFFISGCITVHAWNSFSDIPERPGTPEKSLRDLVIDSRGLSTSIFKTLNCDILPVGYNGRDYSRWEALIGPDLWFLLDKIVNSYRDGTVNTIEIEIGIIQRRNGNNEQAALLQVGDEIIIKKTFWKQ